MALSLLTMTIMENTIQVNKRRSNSIRLKVTSRCELHCNFCHKEGGSSIEDLCWDRKLQEAILALKQSMNIDEIHFTGGEPTESKYLGELTQALISNGFKVKTTTNGLCEKERLITLYSNGLRHLNFSIHTLDPDGLLRIQKRMNSASALKIVDIQKKNILFIKKLGGEVKINTVVSSFDDIESACTVYNFAKDHGISIRFLNNLSKGIESVTAIKVLVQKLNAQRTREEFTIGSSSKTVFYADMDHYEFGVKEIQDFKLQTVCTTCATDCKEHFYGMRLEKKKGEFFVRLCLAKEDKKTFISLKAFLLSEQFKELKKLTTLN